MRTTVGDEGTRLAAGDTVMPGDARVDTTDRAGGWLPDVVLATAWVAQFLNLAVVLTVGIWGDLLWIASTTIGLAAATLVRRRRPTFGLSAWFAVMAGATAWTQLADTALAPMSGAGAGAWAIATTNLTADLWGAVTAVAALNLFTVFPDGVVRHARERWVTRGAWALLVGPVVLGLSTPLVPVPWYVEIPPTPNPYHVLPLAIDVASQQAITGLFDGAVFIGWVLLAIRYRGLDVPRRRQVRWLLVPVVVAVVALTLNLVVREGAPILVNFVAVGLPGMTGAAIAIALLRPDGIDVDRVLRRSIVYGVLWVAIAAAYAGAAALVGFAAGRRVSVGAAVLLTVVATLAFQPARTGLERIADRWVFGSRADPTHVIARLGATLEDTYDLRTLLPRMAATLEDGLRLDWARVRLDGDGTARSRHPPPPPSPPVLTVPIVLDGERLGAVECGPRRDGDLTDEDRVVVATLARQAALAVRNVRLTTELAQQAEDLATSRTRLVRAQESERRRIERNIHDGVQQELVALIGHAGEMERTLDQRPSAATDELVDLRDGLQRVLDDLRELAAGIHPSLLSDHGLLTAVESLAARHPVPVTLRADPGLRAMRASEEVEGAGYFTVAEALANSLKHAEASSVAVTLARVDGSLRIDVSDDGCGFDTAAVGEDGAPNVLGNGFTNMAERVTALGGTFEVDSARAGGTTVTARLPIPIGAEAPSSGGRQ